MGIEISEHVEARLADEARRLGISVKALLERLIDEHAGGRTPADGKVPELPVWHLGVVGSLHRRDLYNDVP